jgi:hypothetical protein
LLLKKSKREEKKERRGEEREKTFVAEKKLFKYFSHGI